MKEKKDMFLDTNIYIYNEWLQRKKYRKRQKK